MSLRTTLLAAVATVGFAAAASAAPITGQISINGYVSAYGSTDISAATGLNFQDNSTVDNGTSPGTLSSFGAGTGTFAGLSCSTGGCGQIKDIASFSTSAPITSFLTLTAGGVSFDLASIGTITRNGPTMLSNGTMVPGSIVVTATGTIHETGFTDTAGAFTLTAQGNSITSFSATTLAAAVPEPVSLAILGGSLAALGLVRRKKA